MTRKQRRLAVIGSGVAILWSGGWPRAVRMKDTITYYYPPTEVVEKNVKPGTRFRLGGLVKEGSVERADGLNVNSVSRTRTRPSPSPILASCRPVPRRAGIVAEGVLQPDGSFRAIRCGQA